jgi:methanogenic corrinoid protein MtbC1
MEALFEKLAEKLIAGKQEEVKSPAQEALDKGAEALFIAPAISLSSASAKKRKPCLLAKR